MPEVTLIPGDGIGPDVVSAARRVLDSVTSSIVWDEVEAGIEAFNKHGTAVPHQVLDSLRRTRLGLKGPMGNTKTGYLSPNTEIRREMGLWCNLRIATHFEGSASQHLGTEIVVIRDVTEDVSRGVQQMVGPDAGIGVKFITRGSAERVARFAYRYATEHLYKRVTIPNYAPSNRTTDGLFLSTALTVAQEFPELVVDEEAVDSLAMHLAMRPQAYAVLLCSNLYGGILCGLAAGLIGSVGLMPGANLDGEGTAVFEAGHGSAPKYAGLNKVNPTGMILSGAMLLDHIGESDAATHVRQAVAQVIREGARVTYDLGGSSTTSDMADAIITSLQQPALSS